MTTVASHIAVLNVRQTSLGRRYFREKCVCALARTVVPYTDRAITHVVNETFLRFCRKGDLSYQHCSLFSIWWWQRLQVVGDIPCSNFSVILFLRTVAEERVKAEHTVCLSTSPFLFWATPWKIVIKYFYLWHILKELIGLTPERYNLAHLTSKLLPHYLGNVISDFWTMLNSDFDH